VSHRYLMGQGKLTFPFPIVRSVLKHGEYHVSHGKRIEEVQEVHEEQTWVLLEWHSNGEQGEGPPESSSTKATHPSGQNQESSLKVDQKGWLVAY